jgi:hypothetical protein
MNKNIKTFLFIFFVLAFSRFIPHPPNFTSLIALSFYVPAFFGFKFIYFVLISFIITDLIIGFHETLLFTWSSVLLIGAISKYFYNSVSTRFMGAFISAFIFFIITNFGVWVTGMYDYNLEGLITSYVMAIPFFGYSVISTLILSVFIETIYKFSISKIKKI